MNNSRQTTWNLKDEELNWLLVQMDDDEIAGLEFNDENSDLNLGMWYSIPGLPDESLLELENQIIA